METRTRVWLMSPDDRPHWQAQWTDPGTGRRRTRSLRTADAREAERLRAWIEDRLAAGLPLDEERLTWAEFRARFMSGHAAGLRPSSRDKLATVLDCLEEICAPASARAAGIVVRFMKLPHPIVARAFGADPTKPEPYNCLFPKGGKLPFVVVS